MFPRRNHTEKTLYPPPSRSNESIKLESLSIQLPSAISKYKKQDGNAVVSSAFPAKYAGKPKDSLATAISGDSKSKKSNGKAVVSSADPGTVIQGFIPPNRIEAYLPHMFAGSVYRLNNFYGSKRKNVYRVAEPDVIISFTWNSVLSVLLNSPVPFSEDRFRFYGYEEFEAACDLKGDLYGKLLSELAGLLLDRFVIRVL
ncbi:hypothetical protein YC2023_084848 [Brassica napus]